MTGIGIIGIGLMGHGMARNLIEKGHALTILANRSRERVDDLIARGATEAKTPRELAAATEIVLTCVPTSEDVEGIVYGDNGMLAGAREGFIHIDTSTANPVSTLKIAADYHARGLRFADAPLARTPKEAQEGRLNVMVGASQELFDEILPILKCFAENVFRVGDLGAGHKIKLINNFMAMSHASVVAEAVATARATGVDPKALYDLVSAGGANSAMFQMIMPYVLEGDASRLQFAIANARKDLSYFIAMANAAKTVGLVGPAVLQTLTLAYGLGHGHKLVPHLTDVLTQLDGRTQG
ncbi:NAD(P)-dependent oxidoreductase [Microvirga arabica]|uniref:NAD(P)-dependent oxidoreductase n=1 Tax=Microvirga arabica TaxID=1128671 RepID=UPI002484667F|nr:NAD(P)-dependent oxidoreductase [Microvirga arabica]